MAVATKKAEWPSGQQPSGDDWLDDDDFGTPASSGADPDEDADTEHSSPAVVAGIDNVHLSHAGLRISKIVEGRRLTFPLRYEAGQTKTLTAGEARVMQGYFERVIVAWLKANVFQEPVKGRMTPDLATTQAELDKFADSYAFPGQVRRGPRKPPQLSPLEAEILSLATAQVTNSAIANGHNPSAVDIKAAAKFYVDRYRKELTPLAQRSLERRQRVLEQIPPVDFQVPEKG